MEREIQELRRQLAAQPSYTSSGPPSIKAAASDTASPRISSIPSQLEQYINSEQAVNSLIELRSGAEGAGQHPVRPNWRLEGITLSQDQVDELFHRYDPCHVRITPCSIDTTTASSRFSILSCLFSSLRPPQPLTTRDTRSSSGLSYQSPPVITHLIRIYCPPCPVQFPNCCGRRSQMSRKITSS